MTIGTAGVGAGHPCVSPFTYEGVAADHAYAFNSSHSFPASRNASNETEGNHYAMQATLSLASDSPLTDILFAYSLEGNRTDSCRRSVGVVTI